MAMKTVISYKAGLRIFVPNSKKGAIFVDIKHGGFNSRDEAYRDANRYIMTILSGEGVPLDKFAQPFNFIVATNTSGGYTHLIKRKVNGNVVSEPTAQGMFSYTYGNLRAEWCINTKAETVPVHFE